MPVARLASLVLFLFSLPMSAQLAVPSDADSEAFLTLKSPPGEFNAFEPLGSFRVHPAEAVSTQSPLRPGNDPSRVADALARLMAAMNVDSNSQTLSVKVSSEGRILAWSVEDKTCYTIRSYVVARDDKDSDTTHPVGFSTCQPSSRYRLKNAQVQQGSSSR